jgi:hypothetical protein
MDTKTFPTKVDAWLVVVLAAGIGASLYGAIEVVHTDPFRAAVRFGATAVLVLVVFLAGIPCQYTLADDHLLVRSGVVRWRIPYVQITDIAQSRSLWSAPAMSLRRVKVSYRGRFMLVSPRERERFIAELTQQVERAKRGGLTNSVR